MPLCYIFFANLAKMFDKQNHEQSVGTKFLLGECWHKPKKLRASMIVSLQLSPFGSSGVSFRVSFCDI
jgi:hypothetical protein